MFAARIHQVKAGQMYVREEWDICRRRLIYSRRRGGKCLRSVENQGLQGQRIIGERLGGGGGGGGGVGKNAVRAGWWGMVG